MDFGALATGASTVTFTTNDATGFTLGTVTPTGAVSVTANNSMTALILNNAGYGTSLSVTSNTAPGLTISGAAGPVGTDVTITGNTGLTSVNLPSMTSVGGAVGTAPTGGLTLNGNGTGLTSVTFAGLQTIDGVLTMNNTVANVVNATVDFPVLTQVNGTAHLYPGSQFVKHALTHGYCR